MAVVTATGHVSLIHPRERLGARVGPRQDRPSTRGRRLRRTLAGMDEDTTETQRADRIEITQGGMYSAEAGTISITQGGISTATAEAIDIHQGGIGRARATDIAISSGGIGLAQGDTVSLDRGLIGAAIGNENRVVQSMANIVASSESTVDQSVVGAVVGGKVTVRQPSAIGVLIAARVEGTVRPIVDWRGALAAGVAIGVISRILRRR